MLSYAFENQFFGYIKGSSVSYDFLKPYSESGEKTEVTFFLTGTDELRKMARRIFEPSVSSDSPVNFLSIGGSHIRLYTLV